MNFSPYEFKITLGLGSSNYEGVKLAVNVRMSPQFAKELVKVLQENVDLYEQQVAKIVVSGDNYLGTEGRGRNKSSILNLQSPQYANCSVNSDILCTVNVVINIKMVMFF